MARITFHSGRILLGLILIAMGYSIYTSGHHTYNKHLHAIRKLIYPDSQASSVFMNTGLTFEQCNQQIVKVLGGIFALSGFSLAFGLRKQGATLLIIGTLFIILTKYNPFLTTGGSKMTAQPKAQMVIEGLKYLALIGAALLVTDNGDKAEAPRNQIPVG